MNGGGNPDYSYAEQDSVQITPAECSAMRLLSTDGYTQNELAMMFNISKSQAHKHISQKCKVHSVPGEVKENAGD